MSDPPLSPDAIKRAREVLDRMEVKIQNFTASLEQEKKTSLEFVVREEAALAFSSFYPHTKAVLHVLNNEIQGERLLLDLYWGMCRREVGRSAIDLSLIFALESRANIVIAAAEEWLNSYVKQLESLTE